MPLSLKVFQGEFSLDGTQNYSNVKPSILLLVSYLKVQFMAPPSSYLFLISMAPTLIEILYGVLWLLVVFYRYQILSWLAI